MKGQFGWWMSYWWKGRSWTGVEFETEGHWPMMNCKHKKFSDLWGWGQNEKLFFGTRDWDLRHMIRVEKWFKTKQKAKAQEFWSETSQMLRTCLGPTPRESGGIGLGWGLGIRIFIYPSVDSNLKPRLRITDIKICFSLGVGVVVCDFDLKVMALWHLFP